MGPAENWKVSVGGTKAAVGVCKCFGLDLEAYTCFDFAWEACNYFGFVEEACKFSDLVMEVGMYFDSEVCKHFGFAVKAGRYFDLVAGVHNYCFGFEACRYSDFEGVAYNCWYFDSWGEDTKCHLPLGSCKEAWGFLHLGSYCFGNLVH